MEAFNGSISQWENYKDRQPSMNIDNLYIYMIVFINELKKQEIEATPAVIQGIR